MIGLLKKDLYALKRQLLLFAVICCFLAFMNRNSNATGFLLIYIPVFTAVLPTSALAYDEQSKWDLLAATMPYSSLTLVLSKYLMGLICLCAAFLVMLFWQLLSGPFSAATLLTSWGFALAIVLLYQAVMLPLVFRWGVEKGRFLILAAAIVLAVLIGGLKLPSLQLSPLNSLREMSDAKLLCILLSADVILYLISVLLSLKFYRKRYQGA